MLNLQFGSIGVSIPQELFELRNITMLKIAFHEVNGTLPATLNDDGALDKLDTLDLQNNTLSCGIPELQLPMITYLNLEKNEFSGEIPSLDNVPQLQVLYLIDNNLEGKIPSLDTLPNIDNLHQLTDIEIYNNKLTGPLPTNFSFFPDLTLFLAHNNDFDGELSNTIFDLQHLEIAILSGSKNLKGT